MIKNVLIATDGSEHANKAVEIGSDIAAQHGAEVILVHVLLRHELPDDMVRMAAIEHLAVDGPVPSAGLLAVDIANIAGLRGDRPVLPEDAYSVIGGRVLEHAEAIARQHGAKDIVKRLEDGKPVDRILEIAKSEGVDLIVSGARGLSNLKALFVGSVSYKLAHLSPVTCVTVR
ncbi:MAG: universal stress protein [Hyphomicrobiales bacterium]|nr:universal stress protein [Hyphomicrobiales bacterium]